MRWGGWISRLAAVLMVSSSGIAAGAVLPAKAQSVGVPDPGEAARRVAIAGLPDGSSQVVMINRDGGVYHRVRRVDATWTDFAPLNGLGTEETAAAGAVSIAGLPDGSTQVVIDGDGGIFHRVRIDDHSWSEFAPLNGMGTTEQAQGSAVAVAGMPDGSTQVVIVGADGGVYHRIRWADGSWSGFAPLNGMDTNETAKATAVAIAGMPDGSAHVVIASTDGRVYHRIRVDNHSWTGFAPLNGVETWETAIGSSVAIAGHPNGSARVAIIGQDGHVYDRVRYSSGSWTQFQAVPGMGTSAAAEGTAVAIAGMPDGGTQLVVAGTDGGVYHRDGSGLWTVLSEGYPVSELDPGSIHHEPDMTFTAPGPGVDDTELTTEQRANPTAIWWVIRIVLQQTGKRVSSKVVQRATYEQAKRAALKMAAEELNRSVDELTAPSGQQLRSLTRSNFRENVRRRIDWSSASMTGYDAHHTLPVKFESFFRQAGLNIHNPVYGHPWCQSAHRFAAAAYNDAWNTWFKGKIIMDSDAFRGQIESKRLQMVGTPSWASTYQCS